MFYGKLPEKNSVVNLSDTDVEILEEFLRFLYSDECYLTEDNAMLVMYLAKKYIVPSLVDKCVEFLERIFTEENIFTFLLEAVQMDEKKLESKCWDFIELNTRVVVQSVAFTNISQVTLAELLKRESLNVEEVDLFKAVVEWSEAECLRKEIEVNATNKRDVIGDAIYQIRFTSMTLQEFGEASSQSCVLGPKETILFYEKFSGLERVSEEWNMSKRSVKDDHGAILRCSRFVEYAMPSSLEDENTNRVHSLCLLFSKSVRLHGFRLLGE